MSMRDEIEAGRKSAIGLMDSVTSEELCEDYFGNIYGGAVTLCNNEQALAEYMTQFSSGHTRWKLIDGRVVDTDGVKIW